MTLLNMGLHLRTRLGGTVPLRTACGVKLLHRRGVPTTGIPHHVQCERCTQKLNSKPKCWAIEGYHYKRKKKDKKGKRR
jgi:hypothetical protein